MGNILVPYRGDLVSARQGFKAAKKIKDRRFKRKLLALWNLEGKLYLWNNGSYRNKEVAKLFGLKPKFLGDTRGLAGFGVKLRTTSISYTSEQSKLTHQIQLTNKCLEIFEKYGTTLKVAQDMGLDGIGIELKQEYIDIAVNRIGNNLFNSLQVI